MLLFNSTFDQILYSLPNQICSTLNGDLNPFPEINDNDLKESSIKITSSSSRKYLKARKKVDSFIEKEIKFNNYQSENEAYINDESKKNCYN